MIESYFDLTRSPFRLGADTTFYFASETHRKAMSYIKFGMQQGEGFVLITGETGVGKSMLIEYLREELDPNDIVAAQMSVGHVQEGAIIDNILQAFRIEACGDGSTARYDAIEAFLVDQLTFGLQSILIIDESQNLTASALEEIRILSNMQARGQSLLQVFLIGQDDLNEVISARNMDQLRQRIVSSYKMSALSQEETITYIDHRMVAAGWSEDASVFSEDAHALVYQATGGVPRQINSLCSRLLLQAAIDEAEFVDSSIVRIVTDELREERKALEMPLEQRPQENTKTPVWNEAVSEKSEIPHSKYEDDVFPDTLLGMDDELDTAFETIRAQQPPIDNFSGLDRESGDTGDLESSISFFGDFEEKVDTHPLTDEIKTVDKPDSLTPPGISESQKNIETANGGDKLDGAIDNPLQSLSNSGVRHMRLMDTDDMAVSAKATHDKNSMRDSAESRGKEGDLSTRPAFVPMAGELPDQSNNITASLLEIKRIMQAPIDGGKNPSLISASSENTIGTENEESTLDHTMVEEVEAFSKIAVGGEDLWIRGQEVSEIGENELIGEGATPGKSVTGVYNGDHAPQSDYIGSSLDRLMAPPKNSFAGHHSEQSELRTESRRDEDDFTGISLDPEASFQKISQMTDYMTSIENRLDKMGNQWRNRSDSVGKRLKEIDDIIKSLLEDKE